MTLASTHSQPPPCLSPGTCRAGAAPIATIGQHSDGILLLHGFSGSPWDVRPLADALIAQGYSVAVPLLAGHGTKPDDLAETTWQDWLADARNALEWLSTQVERVHVAGLSMGALLALLLARQATPRPIASVTLLAPAVSLAPHVAFALRAMDQLGRPKMVRRMKWRGGEREASPSYQSLPVAAVLSVLELQEVVRGVHPSVLVRALVLHGTADATVPHDRAKRLMLPLLAKHGTWRSLAGAGHVLPRDAQAEAVIAAVCDFISDGA